MRPDADKPEPVAETAAPPPEVTAPPPVAITEPEVVPVHTPVEVQSLEVNSGSSAILTYDDEDGEKTTVIWITPDDTVEGI
jgi:hypothetical protein